MSSYYYLNNPKSKLGTTPIPEEEFIQAIFSITSRHGLQITDEMILKELDKGRNSSKRSKKAPHGKHTR